MITITIRFFAMCREVTGREEEEMIVPDGVTADEIWDKIISRYPDLEKYKAQSRIAVNLEYAKASVKLKNGDELCIIPPVSGG
jgi:molybdopterin converting factor subunit 1